MPKPIDIHKGAIVKSGVKADFVKSELRITFAFPLNPETLGLRDILSFLAYDEKAVDLCITPKANTLFDWEPEKPGAETPKDETTVTLSAAGKSVTMTGEELERAANIIGYDSVAKS